MSSPYTPRTRSPKPNSPSSNVQTPGDDGAGGDNTSGRPQGIEGSATVTGGSESSAPARAPQAPSQFDPSWWEGLDAPGVPQSRQGRPAPRAVLIANGAQARYRRETAESSAAEKYAHLESLWKEWYPGLDRAPSREAFQGLWLSIRWSSQEAYRLAVGDAGDVGVAGPA